MGAEVTRQRAVVEFSPKDQKLVVREQSCSAMNHWSYIIPHLVCLLALVCRVPGKEREEKEAIHSLFYWLRGSKFTSRVREVVRKGRGLDRPDPELVTMLVTPAVAHPVKRTVMWRRILLTRQELTRVMVMERILLKI